MISPNAGLRTEKDNTKAVQKMGLAEECPEPMGNSGAATGAAVREQSDDDTVRGVSTFNRRPRPMSINCPVSLFEGHSSESSLTLQTVD